MIYKFMAEHESEFRIQRMCRVLGVGRSGYYAWCSRSASQRVREDGVLLVKIQQEYQISRGTYGSPRIHAALQKQGVKCSQKRGARLIRLHKITGRKRQKRRPVTTQRDPGAIPAPHLLNQEFYASAPDQKWVSDLTYIETAEGWLYLASILDLFSRKVVGWAMADHMEASLVEDALKMALQQRQPEAGLLHHSDQGRQYTSVAYQNRLANAHCQVSMSRTGSCYDNAAMESFFGTLKTECATQPYYTQVGAGTMNPATFLRVLGPEPWNVAYVEPSVRPDDGRYGRNPNRILLNLEVNYYQARPSYIARTTYLIAPNYCH